MEKLYFFFIVMMCIFETIDAQEDECPPGMKHYWKMNENSDSLIDVVNNAVAKAETPIMQVLGIVDSAQSFNGATKVNILSDSLFDWQSNSNFSIEFWMNKSTACSDQVIRANNVIIGRDDPGSSLHWWAGVSCEFGGKFEFDLLDVKGKGTSLVSKKNVIDGNWHHIVVARNAANNSTTLYIDGVKDTSVIFSYPADGFVSTVAVNIGWLNYYLGPKFYYNGLLDELAIYDVPLTDSLITAHYNSGNGKEYCESDNPTPVNDIIIDESVIFSVYPSIVSSELNLQIKLRKPEIATVSVFDIAGRKIYDLYKGRLNEGDQTLTFGSVKELIKQPDGSFVFLQLKIGDKVYTQKIVLAE